MQIEISSLVECALCDSGTVRLLRRVKAENIWRMVDCGELLWAWDVSSGSPRRELRFLFGEVACPQMYARLSIDDVVDRILPRSRKYFFGREIVQMLLISPQQLCRLAPEMRGVVRNREWNVSRENFVQWLKSRHLGGRSR